MSYRVVFDAAAQGYDPTFPAFGLIFVAIGLALWFGGPRGFPAGVRPKGGRGRVLAGFFLAFSVLWVALAFGATYSAYRHARAALLDGTTRVVEGPVTHFRVGGKGGNDESFDVGGIHFAYSSSVVTPGFHRTGVIREQLPVRIHYVGRDILMLEVPEDAAIGAQTAGRAHGSAAHAPNPAVFFLVLPLFVLVFAAVTLLLPTITGWRALAQRFGAESLRGAEAFSGQSVRLGAMGNYNNCVNVCVGADEVSLVPTFPFGFSHRPLVIPMTAITSCEQRSVFWVKSTVVELDDGSGSIRFMGKAGKAVFRAWNGWRAGGAVPPIG